MKLFYQLDGGIKPTKAHSNDAGFDLYAVKNFTLKANEITTVDTRVRLLIPTGYTGLILPRSGLSGRGVTVATGVIDSGYTGRLKVSMSCLAGSIEIKAGSRIAQLLIVPLAQISSLDSCDLELVKTERGSSGFGSSGV